MHDTHSLLSRFGFERFLSRQESNILIVSVPEEDLLPAVNSLLAEQHLDLKTVVATDERGTKKGFIIRYIFSVPKEILFLAVELTVDPSVATFPSLVSVSQSFALYEQEIKSFFGLEPVGHPDPSRIILHRYYPKDVYPLRKEFAWNTSFPLQTEDTITEVQGVEGEGDLSNSRWTSTCWYY
jgi:Ni,Fe-hydrogenase III component G